MDRRSFLQTLSAGALATAVPGAYAQSNLGSDSITVSVPELINGEVVASGSVTLPPPAEAGIDHIVVVTMENRSFDHFLGWLPGADGKQAGLSYTDNSGNTHDTYPLAPDFEGCGHPDPDHSYSGARITYAGGAMNGFLKDTANDTFVIGYYTGADQPYFSALAQNYLAFDRSFAAILGPTFANRMFLWAAQTDRLDDSVGFTSLTTIFDRLSAAGVSHRYYFNNLPYLALWGLKYIFSSSLFSSFLSSAASGALPAVSFIDPNFTILDDGTGTDDHPHADIRNGEAFLSQVVHAVTTGPAADRTVLIITFDEWGGFFEHVAPPRVIAANNVDTDQVNGQVLLGFRLPTLVISPFTRNLGSTPQVNSTVFDHTSILKLIEWRWNLNPLTPRDASSQIGNFATALNLNSSDFTLPTLPAAPTVIATPCFGGGILSALDSAASRTAAPRTPWASLAATESAQQWLNHPNFQLPR
ncbi:MAG TPA: alkaline phosphatase family protein [Bryobacteraceae bacterium]|jgi:phospholipase C|nr:alkaline phosphatase family protein [Bryobacteraceae bacterium]